MINKFNLYDQIAYILVGGVTIIYSYIGLALLDKSTILPKIDLANSVVWTLGTYYLGHIVQALANIVVKENKSDFTTEEKSLLERVKSHFKSESNDYSHIFQLAYQKTLISENSSYIQTFNANYGLYRGWFISTILACIFFLYILVVNWFSILALSLFISLLLVTYLLHNRRVRFYNYIRAKVLQNIEIIIAND